MKLYYKSFGTEPSKSSKEGVQKLFVISTTPKVNHTASKCFIFILMFWLLESKMKHFDETPLFHSFAFSHSLQLLTLHDV